MENTYERNYNQRTCKYSTDDVELIEDSKQITKGKGKGKGDDNLERTVILQSVNSVIHNLYTLQHSRYSEF